MSNSLLNFTHFHSHFSYLLRFPLGMYTFPDGVLTKQDGSKSTSKSLLGLPVTRPFIRFIVGFRGGTSGGADGTPSRRQPVMIKKFKHELLI